MVHAYVQLVEGNDLRALGLAQPAGAIDAWRKHIIFRDQRRRSERMIIYVTKQKAYDENNELSVDYGPVIQAWLCIRPL